MGGIDDDRANEHEVDIAVAVGNLINDDNKDEIHRNDIDSAPPAFVRELIDRLGLLKDGIRVREGAPRRLSDLTWGYGILGPMIRK
jgi:hypothetical protein